MGMVGQSPRFQPASGHEVRDGPVEESRREALQA